LNYLKKQARISYHYSPVEGSYQRGYTRHTEDDEMRRQRLEDQGVALDV